MRGQGLFSRLKPRGVFAKLATVFLVIGLVPFLGMELWTWSMTRKRMTETVIEYWLVRLAREEAVHLDREVLRMRDLVQGWAQDEILSTDLPLARSGNPSERQRALKELATYLHNRHKTRRGFIAYLAVLDKEGNILADSLADRVKESWSSPLAGRAFASVVPEKERRSWVEQALKVRVPRGSREMVHVPLSSKDWHQSKLLWVARGQPPAEMAQSPPPRQPSGYALGFSGSILAQRKPRVEGAVVALFRWTRIQDILDDVDRRFRERDHPKRRGARYSSGYSFLFANNRDTIIAHHDQSLISNSLVGNYGLKAFNEAMAHARYGSIQYEYPKGTPKITGYAHCRGPMDGGFGWIVGVGINDAQIYADVHDLEKVLFIGAVIVTALVILGAAVFSHRITDPIMKLVRYTGEVARGRTEARVDVGTNDEIAKLADSFQIMVHDLEESNQKLVEAEKNAAWQEMARQVAHEIKNPLTPIQLAAQQIKQAYLDRHPRFEEILGSSVKSIVGQCQALKVIASDFADFAAFKKSRLESLDLARLIQKAVDPYLEKSRDLPVTTSLILDLPPGTTALADASEIARVFHNLLNNAREALPAQGGKIAIRACLDSLAGQPAARIEISDTGCGILPENKKRLFEPYFSTRSGGTGLGLALCKKIIRAHGGCISVRSSAGRGTTVTLLLPLVAS